jgi:hypothetical protein
VVYTTRDDAVALCRSVRESSVVALQFTSAMHTVHKILAVEVDQCCKVWGAKGAECLFLPFGLHLCFDKVLLLGSQFRV